MSGCPMTPEKLAELEALEAAATIPLTPFQAYQRMEAGQKLREEIAANARALFAALREAWAAARHARVDADVEVERCTVERDEARRERDEARAALKPSGHDAESCCCPDCCTLREARAEVERMKALHEQADLDRWNALDEVDELREEVKKLRQQIADMEAGKVAVPVLEWGEDLGAHAWHAVPVLATNFSFGRSGWRLPSQEEWASAPFGAAPPDDWYWMQSGAVINPRQGLCRMGLSMLYARVRLVRTETAK